MSPNPSFDASIPVLTEVFQDQPAKADAPPPAPTAVASPAEPEWALLERRLSERIMDQLQGQVDVALQNALAGLNDEIRRSVRQIVAGAVARELAHLQSLKK